MSLWLQSLDMCLYNCGEDMKERAKCIFAHLSMNVPRSWWEHALDTGKIHKDYISLISDLRNELLKINSVSEHVDFDVLVALAFADEQIETQEAKYGTYDSQYSIEEYLTKAQEILVKRNDLRKLAKKINKKAKSLTSGHSGSQKPPTPG